MNVRERKMLDSVINTLGNPVQRQWRKINQQEAEDVFCMLKRLRMGLTDELCECPNGRCRRHYATIQGGKKLCSACAENVRRGFPCAASAHGVKPTPAKTADGIIWPHGYDEEA